MGNETHFWPQTEPGVTHHETWNHLSTSPLIPSSTSVFHHVSVLWTNLHPSVLTWTETPIEAAAPGSPTLHTPPGLVPTPLLPR